MTDKRNLLEGLSIDRDAAAPKPSGGRRALLAIGAVLLAVGGAVGAVFVLRNDAPVQATDAPQSAPAAQPASVPAPLPAPAPAARPGSSILNASGYITARRRATVSAEITGRVQEVLVEEGVEVTAGQVVARLDSALADVDLKLAQARVQAAEADVLAFQANLAEAERVLKRVSMLSTNSFSSEADLTRAKAAVETQTAQLARARADLAIAQLQVQRSQERVDDHTVRAPFAGVVIDKNAQPGEIIAPGSAGGGFTRTGICTLVDMNSLEIEVDVNEAFIGRVFADQTVDARLDAYPDWNIPASVIAIVPTANRAQATVRVRIAINLRDARILPDMGVKVAFLES